MRTLVSGALAVAMLATPTTITRTTPAAAAECPPYVSEEMKRPGGYCDQLEQGKSLSEPVTSNNSDCPPVPIRFLLPRDFFQHADMVLLLATFDPCQTQ